MVTVTMGRSLSIVSAIASFAVASGTAGAQVIVSSDGGIVRSTVGTVVRHSVTISDDSVRSYLSRFEPNVLDDDSGGANVVTMVLDSDGAYVRSSSRHAKVVQAVPGRVMMVNGDSISAIEAAPGRIVAINGHAVRTIDAGAGRVISLTGDSVRTIAIAPTGDVPSIATTGSAISVTTLRRGDASSSPSFFSTEMFGGFSPDEVGAISTKHYAAGEMGKGAIIVTFVYLK